MRHRRNEYGNLLAILGTVIMSVFISELMGQAKQWWQADISTRTGMKKSTSNVIEKAEPTVRKTEKKGDGEMRFKKQLASTPDIEGTKKKSRVKPSIREILSQIGGVLLIIAMFLAFAVAVVALLEQLFGFPWGKPLMERLGTPALIIIVVALWLSDPKRMALLMHQIIQLLFACSCAVGVLLYARTGGAVQEDQAMALLFCVLGIPGLASFIFSITRRRDADDILKFRKTTFYPLLIIVSGAIGQCSAIFGKVLAGVVMGALITGYTKSVWDMWMEKPSSTWAKTSGKPVQPADRNSYQVQWSDEYKMYVGSCSGFPNLRYPAKTPYEALSAIHDAVTREN